jgi:hypothetical protein
VDGDPRRGANSRWTVRSARSRRASAPIIWWVATPAPEADPDPWSTLVYATRGTDVRLTMVDGQCCPRPCPAGSRRCRRDYRGGCVAASASRPRSGV